MHDFDSFDESLIAVLGSIVGEDEVLLSEPMCHHTTFKIGGPADVLVTPRTEEALVRVLNLCLGSKVPLTIVGNGSDLLVGDRGIRGVTVVIRDAFSAIEVAGSRVRAQAGALLRDVALAAAEAGLSGLEPLWGIPASVGGACFMNAGAYGAATAEVLECIHAYVPGPLLPDGTHAAGEVRRFDVGELAMGYRTSRVNTDGLIVLDAVFSLAPGSKAAITGEMDEYRRRREEKQPLEMPSAGSTFKRPEGYFAGKLIMDAKLRGCRRGGAEVSTKHCGFVVNAHNATAADVVELIEHIQHEVYKQFGVELECEVRRIGEF